MTGAQETEREMRWTEVLNRLRSMLLVCNGTATLSEMAQLNWLPFFYYWRAREGPEVVIVGTRYVPYPPLLDGACEWSFSACWPEELADLKLDYWFEVCRFAWNSSKVLDMRLGPDA